MTPLCVFPYGAVIWDAQPQLLQPGAPARLQEASCESRPAGTTRGEGINENMSDKHNQQPPMTFIQHRLIKMPKSVRSGLTPESRRSQES